MVNEVGYDDFVGEIRRSLDLAQDVGMAERVRVSAEIVVDTRGRKYVSSMLRVQANPSGYLQPVVAYTCLLNGHGKSRKPAEAFLEDVRDARGMKQYNGSVAEGSLPGEEFLTFRGSRKS
jgi:hypothetical protein